MSMAEQPATSRPVETSAPPDSCSARCIELWIWLCALAGLAGWSLSVFGELNRAGYVVFFGAAAVIFPLCNRRRNWAGPNWRILRRRFRHPLPAAFAVLALLIFGGSVYYAPTNYTGLNYHLARVLQWLAHGQWFWIHTENNRMNFSGCAFEWLTTPLVLFIKSDRALFMVNFLALLLLPGLIFSVFTRLGVHARVAWRWMWLLPTGYIFLLQCGSIDNDAFAAVFALAAIHFGCRAWTSRSILDLWLSLLAIALLTGSKPTNLPLLLPWAILVLPLAPLARRHWLATIPVAALACIISFLPIAWMNVVHGGDWLAKATLAVDLEVHQPLVGAAGNAFQLIAANFAPPVFPMAGWWNQHYATLLPAPVLATFLNNFDHGFLVLGEIPTEDWAGLGFGVSVLLLISTLGAIALRRKSSGRIQTSNPIPRWLCRCVMIAAWISLLAYSMKSGMATAARLVTPYYLLLLPLLLAMPGQVQVIRHAWWRFLAGGVFALALLVLILAPDRPLWPAQSILSKVMAGHPEQHSVARALQVYELYSHRNDALAGVRELLPAGLNAVGFIGDGDDCDISLWRPFDSRRVEHFLLTDPPELARSKVQYVVVGGWHLMGNGLSIDDWLKKNDAELVATTNAIVKIGEGQQPWYLTRFKR